MNVGTLGRNGLNVEATVQALVEILHAFALLEIETVPLAAQFYSQFLMADNIQVSFAAKQALVRVLRPRIRRRRVAPPTPPRCPSPARPPAPSSSQQEEADQEESRSEADDNDLHVGPGGIELGGIAGNFDALIPAVLGGAAGQNPALQGLELPAEIDDEAMVELAIALSLQEGEGGADIENLHQGLQGLHQGLQQLANLGPALQGFPALQGLAGMLGGAVGALAHNLPVPNQGAQEPSHFSDTTASAPGSDDEGGENPSPPAEQDPALDLGSGNASESGGSVVESIAGDGRRASYGVADNRSSLENVEAVGAAEPELESANAKLHSLRRLILDQLVIDLLIDTFSHLFPGTSFGVCSIGEDLLLRSLWRTLPTILTSAAMQ